VWDLSSNPGHNTHTKTIEILRLFPAGPALLHQRSRPLPRASTRGRETPPSLLPAHLRHRASVSPSVPRHQPQSPAYGVFVRFTYHRSVWKWITQGPTSHTVLNSVPQFPQVVGSRSYKTHDGAWGANRILRGLERGRGVGKEVGRTG
jgi:hypothetical protein